MTLQEQALEIVVKKAKEAAVELINAAVFPALQKVVKESETPIDDVVLAALEAPLKAELLKLIEKI
jgi:hypothetical protein